MSSFWFSGTHQDGHRGLPPQAILPASVETSPGCCLHPGAARRARAAGLLRGAACYAACWRVFTAAGPAVPERGPAKGVTHHFIGSPAVAAQMKDIN